MRASGVMPSSRGLRVGHDHEGGGAVVERAAVAGGDAAVGAEDRLELGDGLVGDAGARAVVGGDDGAVGQRDRRDLAGPEAVGDGLLGEVLRADAELVHLLAGDALEQRQVLGGLAHRDVDVRHDVRRRAGRPRRWHPRPPAESRARLGVGEQRVVRVGPASRSCPCANRDTVSTPARDEHVALAGLDGVQRHAGGLQRRRAVAGHGACRAGGRSPAARTTTRRHVEALLAAGQAAAEHQVVDLRGVELRHLVQRGAHHLRGQVVGPDVLERALARTADGGAGGGDDHGLRHYETPR